MDSCELLSIWLLLWISHSFFVFNTSLSSVVNCFQFDYFCGYHTAGVQPRSRGNPLWIAFNLITFVDITQLARCTSGLTRCCELLSIWLLLWISHSSEVSKGETKAVVNCFQFDYFCGYHTAQFFNSLPSAWLWIAFNLITFVDITQQIILVYILTPSCELLSIWLLLWISHSCYRSLNSLQIVVNCFQFDYFCGYHTARL